MKINRRQLIKSTLINAAPLLLPLYSSAHGEENIPSAYSMIGTQFQVPDKILYAVALTESGIQFQKSIRPWPWTINVQGKGNYFASKKDALNAFNQFSKTTSSIDIGLMQINWRWHREKFRDFDSAISPVNNLKTGAAILSNCHKKSNDWWEAVGHYHSPGTDKQSKQRAEQYRNSVKAHWTTL